MKELYFLTGIFDRLQRLSIAPGLCALLVVCYILYVTLKRRR